MPFVNTLFLKSRQKKDSEWERNWRFFGRHKNRGLWLPLKTRKFYASSVDNFFAKIGFYARLEKILLDKCYFRVFFRPKPSGLFIALVVTKVITVKLTK